jgi:Fe-S cluster assembly ATP-binding protein
MFAIKNLVVSVQDTQIINHLNLTIHPGQMHVLMGPNGSGKSTLAQALTGHPSYTVTEGSVELDNLDLLTLPVHERAHRGLFLAFQYPLEIPGVSLLNFLKTSLNAHRFANKLPELDAADFIKLAKESIKIVGLDESFLYRSLNDGFSGGEKKRCELLQLLLLNPKLIILDETDSGLDIDALRIIADVVRGLRDQQRMFLVITHYQRLLQYLQPDVVHIFSKGNIIQTGDMELVSLLETHGYKYFIN